MGRGSSDGSVAAATTRFESERLEVQELLSQEPLRSHRVEMVCLSGSRAYGMANENSDTDYRGLYTAPLSQLLGVNKPKEQLEREDPDLVIFELSKFCKLAASANPNVLELLWSPVLHSSPLASQLLSNRDLFLSQLVRRTYSGFANSQLRQMKALTMKPQDQQRPEKQIKFARHLFRLMEQGRMLLATGEMNVRVADPEKLLQLSASPIEEIEQAFTEMDTEIHSIKSPLPEQVDFESINQLLVELRLEAAARVS